MLDNYNDLMSVEALCEARMSVEALCEALMIGKNTAYSILNSGELKAYREGSRWKIPREAVNRYIR